MKYKLDDNDVAILRRMQSAWPQIMDAVGRVLRMSGPNVHNTPGGITIGERAAPIARRGSEGGGGGSSSLAWWKVVTPANSSGVAICKQLDIEGNTIDGTDTPIKVFHGSAGDTLLGQQATPRTNAYFSGTVGGASYDGWVYFYEVIVAGERPGYVIYEDPESPVTVGSATIGDSIEGTEAVDTETFDIGGNQTSPLDMYQESRIGYFEAGDEILYGYARRVRKDSNGMEYRVDTEVRYTVDTPDTCTGEGA